MSVEAAGETTPRISRNSTGNRTQLQVFLARGVIAIAGRPSSRRRRAP
jgi:hypothetical protein